MTAVLDSWAIIRFLEDSHPGSDHVAALLDDERPVLSWINLGAVFYVMRRAGGQASASSTLCDLRDVMEAEELSQTRVVEAARMKASYPMASADAFAAATARAADAALWTGEAELLVTDPAWRWHDLR